MNTSIAAPKPDPGRVWAIVGFVYAGFYLLVAIHEFSSHVAFDRIFGTGCIVISALFVLGSSFALTHEYSRARIPMLIGGILSLPLGFVMLIAAARMKKLALAVQEAAAVAGAPAAVAAGPTTFAGRWLGVYISPGSTFRTVVQRPDVFAALYLPALTGLLVTAILHIRVGTEQLARNALALNPNASALPAEVVEKAVRTSVQMNWIFIGLAPVLRLLVPVLVAGLGFLILNVIFKARLDYRANTMITSVGCYAFLPRVLGDIIAILAILRANPEQVNPGSIAPTNPGYFLNPLEVSPGVMTFASSLDVFTIWSIVLLGIGYSAATEGRTKPLPIAATFLGLWLIFVLAQVGLTTI